MIHRRESRQRRTSRTGAAGWKARAIDVLVLDQWEAQKSRLRKTTGRGRRARAVARPRHAICTTATSWPGTRPTAHGDRGPDRSSSEVMVIDLDGRASASRPRPSSARCFELGHAIGNQHWPAVVKGTTVYVPLTVDRKVMASVMKTHAFAGHPLRVRARRRGHPVSRAARVAAAVRRGGDAIARHTTTHHAP